MVTNVSLQIFFSNLVLTPMSFLWWFTVGVTTFFISADYDCKNGGGMVIGIQVKYTD